MLSQILPDDAVEEILKRLPVKSLLRFKAISAWWDKFIETPQFITSHHHTRAAISSNSCLLARHCGNLIPPERNDSFCFIYEQYSATLSTITHEDLAFLKGEYGVRFLATCNGIFCVRKDRDVLLWNPATRQVITLPPFEVKNTCFFSSNDDIYCVSIGFCFDPKSDSYMVVRILKITRKLVPPERLPRDDDIHNKVQVWTSQSSKSWRLIDAVPHIRITQYLWKNISLNEKSYWFVGNLREEMVSFDMIKEAFQPIPLPNAAYVAMTDEQLTYRASVLNGSVALVISLPDPKCFDIWIMNEGNGGVISWSRHLTVNAPLPDMSFLGFWKNQLVLQRRYLLFLNMYTRKITHTELTLYEIEPVCVYHESLASVKQWGI